MTNPPPLLATKSNYVTDLDPRSVGDSSAFVEQSLQRGVSRVFEQRVLTPQFARRQFSLEPDVRRIRVSGHVRGGPGRSVWHPLPADELQESERTHSAGLLVQVCTVYLKFDLCRKSYGTQLIDVSEFGAISLGLISGTFKSDPAISTSLLPILLCRMLPKLTGRFQVRDTFPRVERVE